MQTYSFHLDDGGTVARAISELGGTPAKVEKARRRALLRLSTWIKRRIVKLVAESAGTTQKKVTALTRFIPTGRASGNLHIWVGTNPVAAQFLGAVRWTRRMAGARVGRRVFPGTWSWGPGSKTGTAVMYRTGGRYSYDSPISGPQDTRNRSGIAELKVPIHDALEKKLNIEIPNISAIYMSYMVRELRYALKIEGTL